MHVGQLSDKGDQKQILNINHALFVKLSLQLKGSTHAKQRMFCYITGKHSPTRAERWLLTFGFTRSCIRCSKLQHHKGVPVFVPGYSWILVKHAKGIFDIWKLYLHCGVRKGFLLPTEKTFYTRNTQGTHWQDHEKIMGSSNYSNLWIGKNTHRYDK